MKNYFGTEERCARLLHAAAAWIDTPWMQNSQVKGVGVSCHNLPRALLMECGAFGKDFPEFVGDPTMSRHSNVSIMEPALDERYELQRIDLLCERALLGDVLGIRIYGCIDHLGVCLGNVFTHVLMHKKTCVDAMQVPPWQQRIVAAWRPVEL